MPVRIGTEISIQSAPLRIARLSRFLEGVGWFFCFFKSVIPQWIIDILLKHRGEALERELAGFLGLFSLRNLGNVPVVGHPGLGSW